MAKQFKPVDWAMDWLQNKIPAAEVEARMEQQRGDQPLSAWWQQKWSEFQSQAQPEDELWEYTTPRPYWDAGFGQAGYALIRSGALVTRLVRKFN